jgi:hypothetical protein
MTIRNIKLTGNIKMIVYEWKNEVVDPEDYKYIEKSDISEIEFTGKVVKEQDLHKIRQSSAAIACIRTR